MIFGQHIWNCTRGVSSHPSWIGTHGAVPHTVERLWFSHNVLLSTQKKHLHAEARRCQQFDVLIGTVTCVVEILLVDNLNDRVGRRALHWIPIVCELVANGVNGVDECQITAIT